jgi:hypothetical protein
MVRKESDVNYNKEKIKNNNNEQERVLTYKEIQMQMKCQIGQN